MTMDDITKAMKTAERNRAQCYSKAFAAKTNAEGATHATEADKWGNEWLRLSRKAIKLANNKA